MNECQPRQLFSERKIYRAEGEGERAGQPSTEDDYDYDDGDNDDNDDGKDGDDDPEGENNDNNDDDSITKIRTTMVTSQRKLSR